MTTTRRTLLRFAGAVAALAAARNAGMSYSTLMHGLKAAGVDIDRKMLSDIAVKDAAGFTQLAEQAKASLAAAKAKA